MSKGNIIIVTGTDGKQTRYARLAISAAQAAGINNPHITPAHTASGKTYWRMAKAVGLFPALAEPWPNATVVYVVNDKDFICAADIDPDVERLAHFISLLIAPTMQAIRFQPVMPMSPLMDDAMNGPFLRNPDGSRVS